MDFLQKRVRWEKNVDVLLQLWDIGGQARFTNMTKAYYRGAHGSIVIFDNTEKESFDQARTWKRDIDDKVLYNDEPIPSVLFANKVCLQFFSN
jgi:GTPase SAR1 family protein